MASLDVWLRILFLLSESSLSLCSKRPNILFILIDDLGWNDVSYHGGSDFDTPQLDELALGALQLNNYYVQHYCTPTRSALFSGRYPMRDGLQQWVIRSSSGYGMPLDLKILPEELRAAGYSCHMIGKWHLGFFDPDYTPTFRGFDTFIGYYGDKEDYYQKNNSEWAVFPNAPEPDSLQQVGGYDFRNGTMPWITDEYSTYIYGNETLRLMREHVSDAESQPMFIMYSSQAAHDPYDAPQHILDRYSDIEDGDRRGLAAVIAVLDESLGEIVRFLKGEESGSLWDDTMIIVSTDNGGTVTEGSSNFPLRGGKKTLWEGGIRGTSFITGGWLPEGRRGQEMNALMHVTDWLPTLLSIVGGEAAGDWELDGFDQSLNIINGEMDPYHPRDEILLNVILHGDLSSDGTTSACYSEFCGAIRWRNFKLLLGTDSSMKYSADTLCANAWCEIAERGASRAMHSVVCSDGGSNYDVPEIAADSCLFNGQPCLFDIEHDPCERTDLRIQNREIVEMLTQKLKQYNDSQAFPLYREYPENATVANPARLGGFWSPWENVDIDRSDDAEIPELPKMPGPNYRHRRRRKGIRHANEQGDERNLAVDTKRVTSAVDQNLLIIVCMVIASLMIACTVRLCRWWKQRGMRREYIRIEDELGSDPDGLDCAEQRGVEQYL